MATPPDAMTAAPPRGPRPLDPRAFVRRQIFHLVLALGLLGASLAAGMLGYHHFERMGWRDAFVNAAMLLGGMGPIDQDLTDAGKVFAGAYALYAGLAVIAVTGLLLAPGVHHMMKRVHWEYHEGE